MAGRADLTAGGLRRLPRRHAAARPRPGARAARPCRARPAGPPGARGASAAGTDGWTPSRRARPRSPRGARPSSAGSPWSRCSGRWPIRSPTTRCWRPGWTRPTRIGLAVEALIAAEEPFGIDLPRLAAAALDDAAGHPDDLGRDARADADPRVRGARARPGGTCRARGARLRRHRLRALHRLAARPRRRVLAGLGRPLRLGPRRPRQQRLGGAARRRRRPAQPRTTTTSSRCGPTRGSCRSSPTGPG